MLVLSRKVDEEIYITLEDGRRIKVMVVKIQWDKVRLGIDAPKTVQVHRREIAELIEAEATPTP